MITVVLTPAFPCLCGQMVADIVAGPGTEASAALSLPVGPLEVAAPAAIGGGHTPGVVATMSPPRSLGKDVGPSGVGCARVGHRGDGAAH